MQLYCNNAVILHDVTDEVNSGPAGLSAQRVARTEAELMDAAQELFLDQGYVATTLAQVAQRAGLAARTVYVRFGTKAALFGRVVDRALVGDAEPIDVAHRPGTTRAMTADTLQARIDAFADVCTEVAERAGPLFEVAAQAEAIEPEVAQAATAGRRATAELCVTFWQRAAADGLISDELDPEALAAVTDLLVCADSVVHLRRTHGWTASAHRRLVVDTLTTLTALHAP
jgi:AcrR family transcriptional regulator